MTGVQTCALPILLLDVDKIRGEIGDITDITISKEGQGLLFFENINESEPISIKIHPVNTDISYLYPHSKLFPGKKLFLKQRKIQFKNLSTNKVISWILPANLRYLDGIYDEIDLVYESQICRVTKRIGVNEDGTKYLLDNPIIEDYEYPVLALTTGNYEITMPGYADSYMAIRLMSQNMYTSQFTTKTELNSAITQTKNQIELQITQQNYVFNEKVSTLSNTISQRIDNEVNQINLAVEKKVNSSDYTSAQILLMLNGDISSVKIKADKINIVGVLSAINQDTTTTINGNKITTGTITANQVSSDIITTNNFSAQNINASKIITGTLNGNSVNVTNINASNIASGTLSADRIAAGSLDGNKIKAGTITANQVSSDIITTNNFSAQNINASKITSGTLSADRVSGGTLNISTAGGGYLRAGVNTNHPTVSGLNVDYAGIKFRGKKGFNLSENGTTWEWSSGNMSGIANIYCAGITASDVVTTNGGLKIPFNVDLTVGGYSVIGKSEAYSIKFVKATNGSNVTYYLVVRQGMICGCVKNPVGTVINN